MKEYTLKLPVSMMKRALAAVNEARKAHNAIDAEIAALPAINAVDDGKKALEKRKQDLAAFEARKREATRKAVDAIKAAREACNEDINRQTMPSGADITGVHEADFKLLEYGLVNDPVALARIAAAHDGAPAFRAMVQRYANERDWDGFSYFSKENSLREFATDFFAECDKAATAPSGYYGLLLENESELERQALENGLHEEYSKGIEADATV